MAGDTCEAEGASMTEPALTVFHDGSCPLCRMEVAQYRRSRGANRIEFVDVARPDADPGPDLLPGRAMSRFHVRLPNGQLRSGAAAFVEVWKVLPRWRPAAAAAKVPGVLSVLELGYRACLPLRPALAKIVGRFTGT